jgi:hypothetical protein
MAGGIGLTPCPPLRSIGVGTKGSQGKIVSILTFTMAINTVIINHVIFL